MSPRGGRDSSGTAYLELCEQSSKLHAGTARIVRRAGMKFARSTRSRFGAIASPARGHRSYAHCVRVRAYSTTKSKRAVGRRPVRASTTDLRCQNAWLVGACPAAVCTAHPEHRGGWGAAVEEYGGTKVQNDLKMTYFVRIVLTARAYR